MAWTFLFSSTYINANHPLISKLEGKKESSNRIWTANLNPKSWSSNKPYHFANMTLMKYSRAKTYIPRS